MHCSVFSHVHPWERCPNPSHTEPVFPKCSSGTEHTRSSTCLPRAPRQEHTLLSKDQHLPPSSPTPPPLQTPAPPSTASTEEATSRAGPPHGRATAACPRVPPQRPPPPAPPFPQPPAGSSRGPRAGHGEARGRHGEAHGGTLRLPVPLPVPWTPRKASGQAPAGSPHVRTPCGAQPPHAASSWAGALPAEPGHTGPGPARLRGRGL